VNVQKWVDGHWKVLNFAVIKDNQRPLGIFMYICTKFRIKIPSGCLENGKTALWTTFFRILYCLCSWVSGVAVCIVDEIQETGRSAVLLLLLLLALLVVTRQTTKKIRIECLLRWTLTTVCVSWFTNTFSSPTHTHCQTKVSSSNKVDTRRHDIVSP